MRQGWEGEVTLYSASLLSVCPASFVCACTRIMKISGRCDR